MLVVVVVAIVNGERVINSMYNSTSRLYAEQVLQRLFEVEGGCTELLPALITSAAAQVAVLLDELAPSAVGL